MLSSRNEKAKYSRNNDGWNDEPFLNIVEQKLTIKVRIPEIKQDEERVYLDELNSKFHEGIVSFTPDGNTAYFTRGKVTMKKNIMKVS